LRREIEKGNVAGKKRENRKNVEKGAGPPLTKGNAALKLRKLSVAVLPRASFSLRLDGRRETGGAALASVRAFATCKKTDATNAFRRYFVVIN